MREILFRGKRIDKGEWIEGTLSFLFNNPKNTLIMPNNYFATREIGLDEEGEAVISDTEMALGGFINVISETIGQFTGELDRNHCKIFEGDIVQGFEYNSKIGNLDPIVFQAGKFKLKHTPEDLIAFTYPLSKYACEVVGNIHDNPELLNVI